MMKPAVHRRGSVFLLGALLLSIGCAATLDGQSGGDHHRGQAVEIALNQNVDDSVSAPAGDHTDWKKFRLEDDTTLTALFFWDSPYSEVTVTVRDETGRQLYRLQKTKGQSENKWRGLRFRPGLHFLEIRARKLGSVYTFQLATTEE